MLTELDRLILEKHDQIKAAEDQLKTNRERQTQHHASMQGLYWGIRHVAKFIDGFLGKAGFEELNFLLRSLATLSFELPNLIKTRPGTYQLSHLTYNSYPSRENGFPHFTYGFTHEVSDSSYTVLFAGNSIMAARGHDEHPLIKIDKDYPPTLYLPEDFTLLITKSVHLPTQIPGLLVEKEGEYFAAWRPSLTSTPRAIRVLEDSVIPWRKNKKRIAIFTDTEEVADFKHR